MATAQSACVKAESDRDPQSCDLRLTLMFAAMDSNHAHTAVATRCNPSIGYAANMKENH